MAPVQPAVLGSIRRKRFAQPPDGRHLNANQVACFVRENAEIFKHNGGEQFAFIPCLNDSEPGMDVIRQLVLRELQGWI